MIKNIKKKIILILVICTTINIESQNINFYMNSSTYNNYTYNYYINDK